MKMKKYLLLFALIIYAIGLNAKTSGKCGPSVGWDYNTYSCVLTIGGIGQMYAYHGYSNGSDAPWNDYDRKIKEVIIKNGVEYIGNYSFWDCSNLTKVTIANSVNNIGYDVFGKCYKLKDVYCHAETVPLTQLNAFYAVNLQNVTLHVPNSSIGLYRNSNPWSAFGSIAGLYGEEYKLTYILDNNEYISYELWEDQIITPEPAPQKDGYTFSGWSEIPDTMPAHDVVVTGSFIVNKYNLTYITDNETYKTIEVEYGATITPEVSPTKEGYTFNGWSEIPETMPAEDVTVTGTFTVNKYNLVYMVDGVEYKSIDMEYAQIIIPETEPQKENYVFSGWSEIPETMPAHDVYIYASFTKVGDVNNDGVVDIVDVANLISHLAGHTPDGFNLEAANVNNDEAVDSADVDELVKLILNK